MGTSQLDSSTYTATYGPLQDASRHTVRLGRVRAYYGRIFKTLYPLRFISGDGYRRMIGKQLNIAESRHHLAQPQPGPGGRATRRRRLPRHRRPARLPTTSRWSGTGCGC
ncbi:Tn3 family transposase [Streptomyces olivochromogenes]|uniref:Tn3 family transposase n=1 Tax=Streptomyces olivochromogenes TaxID=1963 RepID=UPI0036D80191